MPSLFKNGFIFRITETINEIKVFGDFGYAVATWVGTSTPINGESIHFDNKMIAIYKKKADGRWLVYRNMFNTLYCSCHSSNKLNLLLN